MKIQFASDLHLEFLERRFPGFRAVEPTDADVLVLAGDIHRHARALEVFQDWPCPVLLLHGNHELYRGVAEDVLDDLRRGSRCGSVTYLECEATYLDDVRFLGCCLWTDFALYGAPQDSMRAAEKGVMDYQAIRTRNGRFSPEDARNMHELSRKWLTSELGRPFSGKTVVITHHGPHRGSIHAKYDCNELNPCFISDMNELIAGTALWIHGHVHHSFDYCVAGTRIVANPRGYAMNLGRVKVVDDIDWENKDFDARKVIMV